MDLSITKRTIITHALREKLSLLKRFFFEKKNNTKKKEYRALKHVCIDCPIRSQCLAKSAQEKKFTVTFYREEYERNNARVNSSQGRYMKEKRQSTVEPVFGTLTKFLGLRKINTLGLKQANKVMHLSAIAYNLKKYLKFTSKTVLSNARILHGFIKLIKEACSGQNKLIYISVISYLEIDKPC